MGVPEIPIHLQSEPELGRVLEHSRQSDGCFGRDTPLAADDEIGVLDAECDAGTMPVS